jgi:coenzyme F420-reducing hydrogenase alpha subunit
MSHDYVHAEELTKVEGHATLTVRFTNGRVEHCELRAVEGSRYFEGILLHRHYVEASEITSRICGICSVAHVLASIQAAENALGVQPSEQTAALRVLLTLGEHIRSHAAHLYFFALPDYVGFPSAIAMAADYRTEVGQAIALLKLGNDIVRTIGGRDMHVVSATVGGFLKVPTAEQLDGLRARLEQLKPAAVATAELFNSLPYPEFHHQAEHFSLHDDHKYALLSGRIRSAGHEFAKEDYHRFLSEYQTPDNTANFVVREGHTYMVGSLPRVLNNGDQLSPDAKRFLKAGPLAKGSDNPLHNNVAQAIELVDALDHAVRIMEELRPKPEPVPNIAVREGRGVGAFEAPRGTLWHEYVLDGTGHITRANVITPTAQNLRAMEDDIRLMLPTLEGQSREEMVAALERLIRAYDPCFSCSAHFLRVTWL